MNHQKRVRELQQSIMNVSTDIQIIHDIDYYDVESDILDVLFCTDKLSKEDFINEIFTILHHIDLGIVCGMQMESVSYNKNTKEFVTNISFVF